MKKRKNIKVKILKSATELFLENSYDKVSVDEIAKNAGVSKGGLFHHFDSKYDLAKDALLWYTDKKMGYLFSDEYLEKASPEEHLKKIIDGSLDFIIEDSTPAMFFLDVYKEALNQEKDLDLFKNFLTGYIKPIQTSYSKMKVKNPKLKALLLVSCLDGLALYNILLKHSNESIEIEKLRKELYKLYIE